MLTVWGIVFYLIGMVSSIFIKKKFTIIMMMNMMSIMLIMELTVLEEMDSCMIIHMDKLSVSMSYMVLMLLCCCMTILFNETQGSKKFLCCLSGLIAFSFFCVSDLLWLFIFFEVSLVPLVMIILGWGRQPERIKASQYLMIYTIFFSIPLLASVMFFQGSKEIGSIVMFNWWWSLNLSDMMGDLLFMSFIFAFLMKIPVFFIHSWLPKAHVEASLEGSIILAGVMLKMGSYGVLRLIKFFPPFLYSDVVKEFIFGISLMGSLISLFLIISSDDVKMSIALMSISHMNFMLSSIFTYKNMVMDMGIFIMISHGLLSSGLFMFVTLLYKFYGSRSILLSKGSVKTSSLCIFSFLLLLFSAGIPPSLSFLGEMMSFICVYQHSNLIIFSFFLYILLNSYYCMMIYGVLTQSSKKKFLELFSSGDEMIFCLLSLIILLITFLSFFFPLIFF